MSAAEKSGAERELRAETVVQAPRAAVWRVLTDLSRMKEWSPETVAMVPLKPGGLRLGQWYLGVNRRGAAVWPTRNVVATLEPERALAWDTTSSGARWIWELEDAATPDGGAATRVVHRRPVPHGVTRASALVAPLLLGGAESHADELEAGMATSVERLKRAVEG